MTKQEIFELLGKVDEGEQLVPIETNLDGADVALTLESVTYRGAEYYDIGLDIRDEGEPVPIDMRFLIGKEMLSDMIDNMSESKINEILSKIQEAFLEGVNESEEEVSAV